MPEESLSSAPEAPTSPNVPPRRLPPSPAIAAGLQELRKTLGATPDPYLRRPPVRLTAEANAVAPTWSTPWIEEVTDPVLAAEIRKSCAVNSDLIAHCRRARIDSHIFAMPNAGAVSV
jgi:hypothetical protein